jgi:hypothetical protein
MIQHIENHINKIKQKPEHIRKRYAFGVSLSFTLIILFFWLISHTLTVGQNDVVAKAPTPIASLTASAGDAFFYIKDLIFGASKVDYNASVIEAVPGRN